MCSSVWRQPVEVDDFVLVGMKVFKKVRRWKDVVEKKMKVHQLVKRLVMSPSIHMFTNTNGENRLDQ